MDYMGRYSGQMVSGVSDVYADMVKPSELPSYTRKSGAGRRMSPNVSGVVDESVYSDSSYRDDLQRAAVEGSEVNYLVHTLPGELRDIANAMNSGDVDYATAKKKGVESWASDNSDWLAQFLSSTSSVQAEKYPLIGTMRNYALAVSTGSAFSNPGVFSSLTGSPPGSMSVIDFVSQDTPQAQSFRRSRYLDQIRMDPAYAEKVARSSRGNPDYDLVRDELSVWNTASGAAPKDITGTARAQMSLMESRIRTKQRMDSMLTNNGLWNTEDPGDQLLRNRAITSYVGPTDEGGGAPDVRDFLEMCKQYRNGVSAAGGVDGFMDIETFCQKWKDSTASATTRTKKGPDGRGGTDTSGETGEITPDRIDRANRLRSGFTRFYAGRNQGFDWFNSKNQNLVRETMSLIDSFGADLKQNAGYHGVEDDAIEYMMYKLGEESGAPSEGASRFSRILKLCSDVDGALTPRLAVTSPVLDKDGKPMTDGRGNVMTVASSVKEPEVAAPLEMEIARAMAPKVKAALVGSARDGNLDGADLEKITENLRDSVKDLDAPLFNSLSPTARDRIIDEWFMPKLKSVYGAPVDKLPEGVPVPRTFTDFLKLNAYPELYRLENDGSATMAPVPYLRSLRGQSLVPRLNDRDKRITSLEEDSKPQDEVGNLTGVSASNISAMAADPAAYVGSKLSPRAREAVVKAASVFRDYATSSYGADRDNQNRDFDGAPVTAGTELVIKVAKEKGLIPEAADLDKVITPLSRLLNGQVNTVEKHPSSRKRGLSYISDSDAEKMDSEDLPAVMGFLNEMVSGGWSEDKVLADQQKAFCAQILAAVAPAIGVFYNGKNDPGSWFTDSYAMRKGYTTTVSDNGVYGSSSPVIPRSYTNRAGYIERVNSMREGFLSLARRVDPVFEAGLRQAFSAAAVKGSVPNKNEDQSDVYKACDETARKALETFNTMVSSSDPNFVPPSRLLLGTSEVPLDFGQNRYNPQAVLLALNEAYTRDTERDLRSSAMAQHGDGFTDADLDKFNRLMSPADAVRVLSGEIDKTVARLESAYGKDSFDGASLKTRLTDLIQDQVNVTDPKLFGIVSSTLDDLRNLNPYVSRNGNTGEYVMTFLTKKEMHEAIRRSGYTPAAFESVQARGMSEFRKQNKSADQAALARQLAIARGKVDEQPGVDYGAMAH